MPPSRSRSSRRPGHLILFGAVAWLSAARGAEFHVAPSGDDGAQGTAESPFRSLDRARDAIRAARKQPDARPQPALVVVHPGVYSLARG